jgi:hypothetical protein
MQRIKPGEKGAEGESVMAKRRSIVAQWWQQAATCHDGRRSAQHRTMSRRWNKKYQ